MNRDLKLDEADARFFVLKSGKVTIGQPTIQMFWLTGGLAMTGAVISLPTTPSVINVTPLPIFFYSTACSTCSLASPQDYPLNSVTGATSIAVRAFAQAMNPTGVTQNAEVFLEVLGACL